MILDEAIKNEEKIAEENQRVVDTGIVFDDVTIDMLYCDDTEVIEEHLANFQKCAEKHRQLAEWLKELKQFKSIAPEQQTCKDAVSRQEAIDAMYGLCDTKETLEENPWRDNPHIDAVVETIEQLSPVTPQHTEAEIQKIQELEQAEIQRAYELGKAEQQTCEKAVSKQAVDTLVDELARAISDERCCISRGRSTATIMQNILDLPPVNPQQRVGHCKDCKYFEYDSMAKVDGMPLIVAHEICSRWGNGCKTKEDGYCFLFEPQERSEE